MTHLNFQTSEPGQLSLKLTFLMTVLCCLMCAPLARGYALAGHEGLAANQADDLDEIRQRAIERLLELQNDDGCWPYEGVYRVRREIPVGYRIGGTAIVCEALLFVADDDPEVMAAVNRGIDSILRDLEHPLMRPSRENTYDVRVWGHIYALDLFCRILSDERMTDRLDELDERCVFLVDALRQEQLDDGGWNYASRRAHASFVTAPAIQALLWARSLGYDIPSDVLLNGREALLSSRTDEGTFTYSGPRSTGRQTEWPGSIARSAIAELTLARMGTERNSELVESIDQFHEHWDELEKRRQKTGTHEPPYGIAPYYFYYGHRYVGQAIQSLPDDEREIEFDRFVEVCLKTLDDDGTWNDRVFDRSKAYGTAMTLMALFPERVELPPSLEVDE